MRDQICGKGVPLQGGPPAQSYVTHFWYMPEHTSELFASSKADTVDTVHQHTATLLESRTVIESGTTGLRTWLASFVLAQYLILHPGRTNVICILSMQKSLILLI